MSDDEKRPAAASALASEDSFDWEKAFGGWRGLVESVLPGVVFVTAFLVWGGFRVPVIAAVGTVVVLVAARLIQRTPITQAVSGVFGVLIGAAWAWQAGDANDYYVPGLVITGAYAAGAAVSIMVRWPLAGIVMAFVKGWDSSWRRHRPAFRRFQGATAVFAATQGLKLAIQLPLYLAGETAALGIARIALGVPYFAATLFVMWLMVRNVALPAGRQDPPRPTG